MANTNNPPDVILELTTDEAKFLLENCEKNMAFAMAGMMTIQDRATLEKLVALNEQFKVIREKLKAQGVQVDG